MKKTKKGITLVELIICCAILVMLGGACTAVLISGERVFSTSANAANTQMEANVLQTYLINKLPSTKRVNQIDVATAEATTEGTCLYFDDEGVFSIRSGADVTTIDSVATIKYSIVKAGDSDSITARAQLQYTATMKDGNSFSGGMILGNMKYDDTTMVTLVDCDLETNPLYLSSTDAP